MLLLDQLAAWLRARRERTDCPQHHWHPDRRGWTCCWGEHRLNARNTAPPEHTTRLCQEHTGPVDTLHGWLRTLEPGQHRRPALSTLRRRPQRPA